jgi:antitoxin CptB
MDGLTKIRWQCRRGSRELDLLLNNYLDTRYPVADEEEKARFVELLKLDDSELLERPNAYVSLLPLSNTAKPPSCSNKDINRPPKK